MIALAWRNLWRQPRRTLLTLAVITLACSVTVFLLALQVGSYATMKDNTLSLFDGYAQVQQPAYLDDPGIRRSIDHPEQLAQALQKVPGVGTVAARGVTYALLSHGDKSLGALVVGVQPRAEARVSRIAHTLQTGHYLEPGGHPQLVMGEALARNLGVKVGDRVTLLGTGRDGSVAADILSVRGIFDAGIEELNRQLIEIPLARFQADFGMPGQANLLVVSGQGLTQVQAALPALRRIAARHGLTVRAWNELQPGLAAAIHLDASTSMLWYASALIVVVVLLLNTLLMSVLERTREFGMLLALGMRSSAVGRMVWLELALMLLLGLGAGMLIGGGVAGWYGIHGLSMPGSPEMFKQWGLPSSMYPRVTAFSLLLGPAVIAVSTALASLYPYRRIRRLRPVEAMRTAG